MSNLTEYQIEIGVWVNAENARDTYLKLVKFFDDTTMADTNEPGVIDWDVCPRGDYFVINTETGEEEILDIFSITPEEIDAA